MALASLMAARLARIGFMTLLLFFLALGVGAARADVEQPVSGVSSGQIADDAVTNAKLANMAEGTVKCRATAGTGSPEDCTTLPTAASGALTGDVTKSAGSSATTLATITNPVDLREVVSTADFARGSTTFGTITGLSLSLTAGKTYSCRGWLSVSGVAATGGIKVRLTTPDTLTATTFRFTGANFNGTTVNARNTGTALTSGVIANATATVTDVEIVGSIEVNAAGTLVVQHAQNAADATNTVVAKGSTFSCKRVN